MSYTHAPNPQTNGSPVCLGYATDRANWRRAVMNEIGRTGEPLPFVAAFAVDLLAMTPGGITSHPEHPRVRALLNSHIEPLTGHTLTAEDVREALHALDRRGMLPPWCHPLRDPSADADTIGGAR